jgi:cytochrome c-type biogenesis protein CcmE
MRKPESHLERIVITAVVACAGIAFVVYSVLHNRVRYRMVDELMAQPTEWVGKTLQVHGWVEPGSIHKSIVDQQAVQTFVLEKNGKRIAVENHGPPPDTFTDQAEVIATGRLEQRDGEYLLVAEKLDAKCPSKYEGAASNKALAEKPVFH